MSTSARRNAYFQFTCEDDSGIGGFSFCLDHKPNTLPDTVADPVRALRPTEGEPPRWVKTYGDLRDGRWFFHVRAMDSVGNWGRPSHYEIIVDTERPQVKLVSPLARPVAWNQAIAFKLSDKGAGIDPNSIRLLVAGRTFDVFSKAVSYNAMTGELLFTPSQGSGRNRLLFADGERVRLVMKARDFAGRSVKRPFVCTFVAASPLKIGPPRPAESSGWYRAMPRIDVNAPEGMTGEVVLVDEGPREQQTGSQGTRLIHIVTEFKPKFQRQASAQRYHTTIIVHEGEVGGRAEVVPAAPNSPVGVYLNPPTIRLMCTAQVARPGGLTATFYRGPDFRGVCHKRISGVINFDNGGRKSSKRVPQARSGRWEGWLKVDKTQTYKLEIVTTTIADAKAAANLWIDGDLVLDASKRQVVWFVEKKVLLTKGYHKIRLEYSEPNGKAWWLQLFWWRPDRQWRELIPSDQLYGLHSLTTSYYRWDNKGKWRVYRKPLVAPRGQHTLYYFAKDEAGHKEKVKTLQVNVATEKPKAATSQAHPARPAGVPQAQGAKE